MMNRLSAFRSEVSDSPKKEGNDWLATEEKRGLELLRGQNDFIWDAHSQR